MLQWLAVSHAYNDVNVLRNVTAHVGAGQFLGVIGANGAGKSSLLQLAANVIALQSGAIEFQSKPIRQISDDFRAKNITYLAQTPQVEWPLSVQQVVALGRLPHSNWMAQESEADLLAITDAMLQTDIISLSNRRIDTLSGGERMRVLVARMFATRAQLLVADEPIAALDLAHQLQLLNLFKQHCVRGGAAVIALHDLNMAARFCDQLLLLHQGTVLSFGKPETVLTPDNIEQAFGVSTEVSFKNEHLVVQLR